MYSLLSGVVCSAVIMLVASVSTPTIPFFAVPITSRPYTTRNARLIHRTDGPRASPASSDDVGHLHVSRTTGVGGFAVVHTITRDVPPCSSTIASIDPSGEKDISPRSYTVTSLMSGGRVPVLGVTDAP